MNGPLLTFWLVWSVGLLAFTLIVYPAVRRQANTWSNALLATFMAGMLFAFGAALFASSIHHGIGAWFQAQAPRDSNSDRTHP